MHTVDGSAGIGDDGITIHGELAARHWFVGAAPGEGGGAAAMEAARCRVRAGLEGTAPGRRATDAVDELAPRRRDGVGGGPVVSVCTFELASRPHRAARPHAALRRLDILVRAHRPGTLTVFRHASLRAVPGYLEDVLDVPADACEPLGAVTFGTWGATAVALGCAPSWPFSPSNAFYRALGERLRARADAAPGTSGPAAGPAAGTSAA